MFDISVKKFVINFFSFFLFFVGSVDIIDLADNIISVTRITENMVECCKDDKLKQRMEGKNTMLSIKKNREYGDTNIAACYKFEPNSKRIFGEGITSKVYEWEKGIENRSFILDKQFEEEESEQCPF